MGNKENVKRDNRAISDEFLGRFKPEGDLHPFIKLVKAHESDLELCFRGNGNNVNIYCKNHQVFKIEEPGNIEISFSIARYCKNWKILLGELNAFGFEADINNTELEISKGKTIYIKRKCTEKPLLYDELEKIYRDIIEKMFNRYFSVQGEDDTIDYFKKVAKKEYKCKPKKTLEKIRQQEIYSKLRNTCDSYFLYDLEYNQQHDSLKEANEDTYNNAPDMLGLYFNASGVPERLVLVEVKCTKTAVNDKKSGLDKHISCMENYVGCEEHIRARRQEAFEIIKQYAELELRGLSREFIAGYDKDFYKKHFENMRVETLIILTDEAQKCSDCVDETYHIVDDDALEKGVYTIYSKVL